MKVVIIGGGTAGSEVAWRLRQQNKDVDIVILEKSQYPQYSPCALPFLISGQIPRKDDLFLFDDDFYKYNRVDLHTGCCVKEINREKQAVFFEENNENKSISYDYLVFATGSKTKVPNIPGLNSVSFFKLKNLDDAEKIGQKIKPKERAVIIGGGYIGVELADSLNHLGLKVSLIEKEDFIVPAMFDAEVAERIQAYIKSTGVKIITRANINRVTANEIQIGDQTIDYDHLFISCGAEPNILLAETAGIKCDQGIIVDDFGKTSDDHIFACGDCVQSTNLIDNQKIFSQLATTAVKQAEIIAANILGAKEKIPGSLNTSLSRYGRLIFGVTGVTEDYCRQNNIKLTTVFYSGKTKPEYFPGDKDIYIKLIARPNRRIIGCQIAGFEQVSGRINMTNLAIKQDLTLEEFISIETGYNPAVSPIFDPLIIAAQICLKKIKYQNETS